MLEIRLEEEEQELEEGGKNNNNKKPTPNNEDKAKTHLQLCRDYLNSHSQSRYE